MKFVGNWQSAEHKHTPKKRSTEHRFAITKPLYFYKRQEKTKKGKGKKERAQERGKYASLLLIDLLIGGLKSQSVNVNKKYGPLDARTFLLGSLILFIDEQVAAPLFA